MGGVLDTGMETLICQKQVSYSEMVPAWEGGEGGRGWWVGWAGWAIFRDFPLFFAFLFNDMSFQPGQHIVGKPLSRAIQ